MSRKAPFFDILENLRDEFGAINGVMIILAIDVSLTQLTDSCRVCVFQGSPWSAAADYLAISYSKQRLKPQLLLER